MKNKSKLIILALPVVLQTLFCNTALGAENSGTELVVMMIKFGKVMLGVLIASVLIYLILYIWNLILKRRTNKQETGDLSLKTPQNTDDAILFFINKNKLK